MNQETNPMSSEPTPFTPTRVKIPRFQMHVADFFVLFGFLAFHLALWGKPIYYNVILTVFIGTTLSWFLVLWIARFQRDRRTQHLIVYMIVCALPLNLLFPLPYAAESKKEQGRQRSRFSAVSAELVDAWIKWAPASGGRLTVLKDMADSSGKFPVLDAECADPLHKAAQSTPRNGLLIKLLPARSGFEHTSSWPLRIPVVFYPASYSSSSRYTYLIDETGHDIEVDWGPDTHEKVSKLDHVDPADWQHP